MPTKRCPDCGQENNPDALLCPRCGASLSAAGEPSPPGAEPEARTAILRTFTSQVTAQVVADHLESANIPVMVGADDCGGLLPVLSPLHGFHLLVKASDLPRAEEALRDIEAEFGINTAGSARPTSVVKLSPHLSKIGWFVLGTVVGALACYAVVLWRSNYTGTWTEDLNKDGRPDVWWDYKKGVVIKTSEDRDFNGRADAWWHSPDGVTRSAEDDTNDDGKPDVWWTYENGYANRNAGDFDFDGKLDGGTRFAGNLPVQSVFQASNQLGYWRRDYFTNGVLRVTILDRDRDGVLDERILFDAFGTFLRVEPMK